jgi:hypothetical protein
MVRPVCMGPPVKLQSAGAHAKSTCFCAHRVRLPFRGNGTWCLFLSVEEVVVGGVRHERLLAHIAGDGAAGEGSESTAGVEALDESGFGQQLTAGWSLGVPDGLQQEASDGTGV